MSEPAAGKTTEFTIGSEVRCGDGVCGKLRRVIVDPAVREVTHLAVEPKHGRGAGRLVPISLVDVAGKEIRLRCTLSQYGALEEADQMLVTHGAGEQLARGPVGMGGGFGGGLGSIGLAGIGPERMGRGPHAVASDYVPTGEVEVQRGDHVYATDGAIGRVQAVVVDSTDHRLIAILLAEGHLWGQKRVLIPIGAVTSVDAGVRLSLSKDQVLSLPSDESPVGPASLPSDT